MTASIGCASVPILICRFTVAKLTRLNYSSLFPAERSKRTAVLIGERMGDGRRPTRSSTSTPGSAAPVSSRTMPVSCRSERNSGKRQEEQDVRRSRGRRFAAWRPSIDPDDLYVRYVRSVSGLVRLQPKVPTGLGATFGPDRDRIGVVCQALLAPESRARLSRRGTEVVVTGAPRKRLVRKGTWVRIPPSPHNKYLIISYIDE